MVKIYCEENFDMHEFYMADGNKEYYLFSQKYKCNVNDYFNGGILLDKALNHGAAARSRVLNHTMDKIKTSIMYIEKEYNITILNCTKNKIYKCR